MQLTVRREKCAACTGTAHSWTSAALSYSRKKLRPIWITSEYCNTSLRGIWAPQFNHLEIPRRRSKTETAQRLPSDQLSWFMSGMRHTCWYLFEMPSMLNNQILRFIRPSQTSLHQQYMHSWGLRCSPWCPLHGLQQHKHTVLNNRRVWVGTYAFDLSRSCSITILPLRFFFFSFAHQASDRKRTRSDRRQL